ncbi:MAG: integrase core domain-containing protein [Myxococcales bacterium]|nr:integrase core domain-containing protein [Myxococcales bacterium]
MGATTCRTFRNLRRILLPRSQNQVFTRRNASCCRLEHGVPNAVAESFFASLKREMHNADWIETASVGTLSAKEFIETYNYRRLHSSITTGRLSSSSYYILCRSDPLNPTVHEIGSSPGRDVPQVPVTTGRKRTPVVRTLSIVSRGATAAVNSLTTAALCAARITTRPAALHTPARRRRRSNAGAAASRGAPRCRPRTCGAFRRTRSLGPLRPNKPPLPA